MNSSAFTLTCLGAFFIFGTACSSADLYPLTSTVRDGESTDGEVIYVAPDGDDSNPGTLAEPLRSIARARDLVRTKNDAMTADITVSLRGGTYVQSSTLEFEPADSGRGGFYVKYVAYPGERPLITGGRLISGFSVFDAKSNIYSASAGSSAFRQLYVNGVKATRARSPNLGANHSPNFERLSGWDKTAHNVQLSASSVSDWNHLDKVEMHLMTAWADNTLRIATITTANDTAYVTFQSPEDSILFVRPNPRLDQMGWGAGRAFYFENALEFLDQPGEWYLDEEAKVVYYKPRNDEDMTNAVVVAPTLETLVSVKGKSTSEQVSHLWFQGLTFAHSTYLRPSESGYLDAQAGPYNLTADADNHQTIGRPAAGVYVTNANHLHMERNWFTQLAATGLDLSSGTQDDTIVGNAFTDIGGSAISIGKFVANDTTEYHTVYAPTDENEVSTRDRIQNNYVGNVTTEIQGACGIAAGYPAYLDIEHNEITLTNFSGISVGYGWTSAKTAMSHNRINYNHIHHIANVLAGGAGISTMSNQEPDSELQYNFLHDFGQSEWADYATNGLHLDEGTTGYTVAHNLMENTPGSLIAQSAGSNLVTDNGTNPEGAENTRETAGIEPSYADVKELASSPVTFSVESP